MRKQRVLEQIKWTPGLYLLETQPNGDTLGKRFSHCSVAEINAAVLTEAVIRTMLNLGVNK
ncbi:hypothetical protein [Achromobacter phage maay_LB1]|nr:hypothetical protein [Achromobacter phage maay_LB1]WNO48864.1 hypothetical protein [Achromobacter phage kuwaak_TL2]